jgi:hypothetical protein
MVERRTVALLLCIVFGPLHTLNEWLRLNGSQILAAILVFAVQPGVELPPLVVQLFSRVI